VKCQVFRTTSKDIKLSARSIRIVAIYLSSVLFFVCFVFGCREEKDLRRVVAENSCKEIIEISGFPERTKKLARRVLDDWDNGLLDPEPILVHAGYAEYPDRGYRLFLTMSDEDFDVAGFVVRESHRESQSDVIVIQEQYPVFPDSIIGDFQAIVFRERIHLSQIKDEQAWSNYIGAGAEREIIYRRRAYPVVWISLPNPPTVEVDIWIYDSAGNKSQPVPLEYGHPRMKKPRA